MNILILIQLPNYHHFLLFFNSSTMQSDLGYRPSISNFKCPDIIHYTFHPTKFGLSTFLLPSGLHFITLYRNFFLIHSFNMSCLSRFGDLNHSNNIWRLIELIQFLLVSNFPNLPLLDKSIDFP